MDIFLIVFQVVVLVLSVMIHEISHGAVAYILGDPTAKNAGRLTLNPIPHIDPIGSVILPLVLAVLPGAGPIIGWAKPVPVNPLNLRNPRWGSIAVSAAGPLSNLAIAVVFGIALRVIGQMGGAGTESLILAFGMIAFINLFLAVLNLLPVPPLDGSHVLFNLLPRRFEKIRLAFHQYQMILLLFFLFFVFRPLASVVTGFFSYLTGFTIH